MNDAARSKMHVATNCQSFHRYILILLLVRLNLSFIYTNEHEREKGAGQDDYISKPIKRDVVFKMGKNGHSRKNKLVLKMKSKT